MSKQNNSNARLLEQMLELMEASGMDLSPQQQQQQQQQQQKDQAADESPVDRLAALLRPQGPTKAELDEAARIRQKEKFALRDFFSAQAAAESKKRGYNLTPEEREAAASDLRYDYVDSVHTVILQVKSLSEQCWYVALIGVLLMVVARELEFSHPGDSKYELVVLGLRCCNSLVTALLIYLIYLFHSHEFKVECLNAGYLNELPYLWQSERTKQFLWEVLICLIHDVPFVSWSPDVSIEDAQSPYFLAYFYTTYSFVPVYVQNPFVFLMVLRLYLLIRYWRDQEFGASANILSIFSNFAFNSDFAMRAILDADALTTLGKFMILLIMCMSYINHVCEREAHPNFFLDSAYTLPAGQWTQSYFGSIWLMFASVTTLGYADVIPTTYCGRIVCLSTVILGISLISGLTGAFISMLNMPPFERKMVDFMQLVQLRQGNIHQSANTIAAAFRYYKAHRYLSLIRSEIKKLQESGKEEFDDEILGGIRVWRATRDLDRKHQLMLSQILVFKTYRTDLKNYTSRFEQTAYLQNLLFEMSKKLGGSATIIAGQSRPQYVDNFIVHQMVLLFQRQVDKHAAAAGVLKAKVEGESDESSDSGSGSDSEDEKDTRTQGYFDPYTEKYVSMDGTKQMTANQMRLDRARAKIQKEQELHAKTARISGIFGDRGGGNKKDMNATHISRVLQQIYADHQAKLELRMRLEQNGEAASSDGGAGQRKYTMATLTSSSSSIVPANKPMKAVNLQYVDKQKLAHMSKNLSSADVTALNAMIGQAQANPGILKALKVKRRKTQRWRRAPGEHHHHHHLHGNLPPAPKLVPIPKLLQSHSMTEEFESDLMKLLTNVQTLSAGLATITTRMIKIEREVRNTTREANEWEPPVYEEEDDDDEVELLSEQL